MIKVHEVTVNGRAMDRRGILYGLPVIIDGDRVGPANWFVKIWINMFIRMFGYNGMIMEYPPGKYWHALWVWLVTPIKDLHD